MEEEKEKQKVLSISEWATSTMPFIESAEIFTLRELADTLTLIFTCGLFLLRIELNQTEFFRSWEILYGNEPAKLLFLESDRVEVDRKKLKRSLQKIEKANSGRGDSSGESKVR